MRGILCISLIVSATLIAGQAPTPASDPRAPSERQRVKGFRVEEATIAQIHEAMTSGANADGRPRRRCSTAAAPMQGTA